jgi:hypothetical protein
MDVPCYRAFLLDTGGHVFAVRVLNTSDDSTAIRLAAKLQTRCFLIEVWNRTNRVGTLEPRNKMT